MTFFQYPIRCFKLILKLIDELNKTCFTQYQRYSKKNLWCASYPFPYYFKKHTLNCNNLL